jgi:hypothetical protein
MRLSSPKLRLDEFDRLTLLRGWKTDAERCLAIGISQAHMSRIRRGEINPGGAFIHQVMKKLEVPYPVLFVDPEPECESAVAS